MIHWSLPIQQDQQQLLEYQRQRVTDYIAKGDIESAKWMQESVNATLKRIEQSKDNGCNTTHIR